jgi:MFS family permease
MRVWPRNSRKSPEILDPARGCEYHGDFESSLPGHSVLNGKQHHSLSIPSKAEPAMAELHFDDSKPDTSDPNVPWYKTLTRYHWFVLGVAALGWLFDCLDQQLFVLARPAVMKDLYPETPGMLPEESKKLGELRETGGDIATSVFLCGWALGGIVFGVMGDRVGRAKTMMITILLYSLFTGLSALSKSLWDFCLYRFLTGLGVGGEFAVGVALVAEVMPNRARPYTLGLLQALSAVGNISAALINLGLGLALEEGLVESPWRIMFLIGALPALLALVIRSRLKEPEVWVQQQALQTGPKRGFFSPYADLFSNPTWRKHALLGLVLGCSGIIGLWSVGFFVPDLTKKVFEMPLTYEVLDEEIAAAEEKGNAERAAELQGLKSAYAKELKFTPEQNKLLGDPAKRIEGKVGRLQSYSSMAINIGAFFGMFGFGALSQRIGRKPTFVIALLAACLSTMSVFWFLKEAWQIWVMVPIMGFCQLSLFAGYAIYFPELFPTRLRSTGTSFCYNVGRLVAAVGPLAKIAIRNAFTTPDRTLLEVIRYAGVTMCGVFLVGLLALPFLPETRGKPLPE